MVNPFVNVNDEELMLLYQKDNYMAFEALYDRHKSKVYSFLDKRLQSKSEVEDIFQSVFIKIHKSRGNYSRKHSVLAWFYVIARSELYDAAKKRKLYPAETYEGLIEEPTEPETMINQNFNIDNEKLLTQAEKNAIKLRYLEDKDFSEISEILNTTQQNSRKIISRALAKLKKKYQGRKS